ncbi:unnamed protein product, partial [Mesorhabditis belari]|uniref:C-type lectin domain-containing protein n=1 Tax=Mesorhabditis belari TaxID=2138241 RepID=A0AAF3EBM7_9BILA
MKIFLLFVIFLGSTLGQCPSGSSFVSELNACLMIDQTASNFTVAEASCVSMGGHLLSIHSIFQNAIVLAYLQQAALTSDLYIGLFRNSTSIPWSWTDRSTADYQKWASGEPGSNLCSTIRSIDGQWHGAACSQNLGHICAVSMTASCPRNWNFFNGTGMCYYHGQNATFLEAEKVCRSSGGHLASVHSDAENDFIKNLTWSTQCAYVNTWISGTTLLGGTFDQSRNRTTWWSDGSPADYTHSLRAFPMNSCPQDEEKCGGGNWRIGRYSINNSVPYPDYVCKTAAISHSQCPTGWQYLSLTNACYWHEMSSMSFWDAEVFCEAFGGNLASIHSDSENQFIQDMVWNPSCGQTQDGFQLGEVLLGGVYSGFKKGISYWIDGSAPDFMHQTCDLFGASESTIVMAAHPNKCGSCFEGQWFLPNGAPDSNREYGEFICKAPAYSHLKRLHQ